MGTRIDWRRARKFKESETTREGVYGPRQRSSAERLADKILDRDSVQKVNNKLTDRKYRSKE